jgi:hypothetical protein
MPGAVVGSNGATTRLVWVVSFTTAWFLTVMAREAKSRELKVCHSGTSPKHQASKHLQLMGEKLSISTSRQQMEAGEHDVEFLLLYGPAPLTSSASLAQGPTFAHR